MEGGSLRVPATSSQFCSVQPLPRGPQSIGSDWTGVGRKASILLCTIVIIDFDPVPSSWWGWGGGGEQREARGGGGMLLWFSFQEVELMYTEGERRQKRWGGGKIVHAQRKKPSKRRKTKFSVYSSCSRNQSSATPV